MSKRVTRDEVALRAGVSSAVVSYVINDGPRPVAEETRARVLRVIEDLGYYPNAAARSLKLKRTFTVGLVTPDITNPVYAEIAKGMEDLLTGAGQLLLLCDSARDPDRERHQVEMLRQQHVDGVVLIPSGDPQHLVALLKDAGIAVVVLEDDVAGVPCVVVDEIGGGRDATRHLLHLGHDRIGLLRATPSHRLSRHRFDGYREALSDAGIAFDPSLVVETAGDPQDSAAAAERLLALNHAPTAILTHNDMSAVGAMHAAWKTGLVVPDDLSVMGYDNISISAYVTPPLTTVSYPHHEMGRRAARMLFEMTEGTWSGDQRPTVIHHEVVVRGSTAPPPR